MSGRCAQQPPPFPHMVCYGSLRETRCSWRVLLCRRTLLSLAVALVIALGLEQLLFWEQPGFLACSTLLHACCYCQLVGGTCFLFSVWSLCDRSVGMLA